MAPAEGGDRRSRATELPPGLFRFILATSWRHQLLLVALTTAVFLFEVVPLELQRRAVNDLIKGHRYSEIVLLCIAYFAGALVQGGTKLAVNIYRSWVGECAKRDLRRCVLIASGGSRSEVMLPEAQGTAIAVVVAEVEPVGSFVGTCISEPLLQGGILATVVAYLTHIDPWMGVAALALFVPQLVFVPLMQQAMNRRTGARVWLLRQLGAGVIDGGNGSDAIGAARVERVFRLDMGIFKFKFTMNFLMNLCSHLQVIAALLIGGWWVLHDELQIGGVVAFISGVGRLNDPWGDLVNYFREFSLTRVKYRLLIDALSFFAKTRTDATAREAVFASVGAEAAE